MVCSDSDTTNDKTLDTATWLTYDKVNRDHVDKLRCSVCTRFESKINKCRNFSCAFIHGTFNLCTSAFKDHAKSEMHAMSMRLLRKEQSSSVTEYSPIAKAMYRMEENVEKQSKRKFDVAYLIAKEGMAFSKMSSLCQLQERHDVRMGVCYKNEVACATFVHYLSQDFQIQLSESLHRAKFLQCANGWQY